MPTRLLLASMLVLPTLGIGATGALDCRQVRFSGQVEAGQSFQQAIGDGLVFFLKPSVDHASGWRLDIGPHGDPDPLYVYHLTPPWRGRRPTDLDTSYGTLARDAVAKGDEVAFWFALDRKADQAAGYAVGQLIFSGATQSDEKSLQQLESVRKGHAVLRVLDAAIQPGTLTTSEPVPETGDEDDEAVERLYGKVLRMSFEVELTVPKDFRAAATFRPKAVPCPGSWRADVLPHPVK